MRDAHGRTVDTLRVSVTDRCDLRCFYCMPSGDASFAPRGEILTAQEIVEAVRALVESAGLARVRITGGEPLLRPDLVELVAWLSTLGLQDLALTTNGQRLAPLARPLRAAGLHRVNISLDSLDPERFRRVGRGGDLAKTIEGIDAAREAGLRPVRLNAVLLRGINEEEIVDLVRFGVERGVELRFLELMAIGVAAPFHRERFLSMDDALARLRSRFEMEELPRLPGSTSISFGVTNGNGLRGTVGFIAPVSRPFCDACRRLRLSAAGSLRGCLMSGGGMDLAPLLRGAPREGRGAWLADALRGAILDRPRVGEGTTGVRMHTLGG